MQTGIHKKGLKQNKIKYEKLECVVYLYLYLISDPFQTFETSRHEVRNYLVSIRDSYSPCP